jgi:hypothetical protein
MGLTVELTSLRRGRRSYRLLVILGFLAGLVVFGGMAVYIFIQVHVGARIFMAIAYFPIGALVVYEFIATAVGGRTLFVNTVVRFIKRRPLPSATQHENFEKERSLLSYLLFPRSDAGGDNLVKWLFAPGLFLVIAVSTGTFSRATDFVILWLVLEYLVYQARYQWNDLRGVNQDQRHVEKRSRRRLPKGHDLATTRRNVTTSVAVATARLAVAAITGAIAGLLGPVLLITVLVLGIAIIYEWLRSRPVQAGMPSLSPTVLTIWFIVGAGYAIRAGVGLTMAGVPLSTMSGVAGLAYSFSLGAMLVLLAWALDATSRCRIDQNGNWRLTTDLIALPHLATLLPYAGRVLAPPDPKLDEITHAGRERILEYRGKLIAPWNLSFFTAACAALVLGVAVGQPTVNGASYYFASGILVVLATIGLAAAPRTLWRTVGLVVSSLTIAGFALTWPSDYPYVLVLLWLVVGSSYVGVRAASYYDLKHLFGNVNIVTVTLAAIGLKRLVGEQTWRGADFNTALRAWAAQRGRVPPQI